jgi:hypothetical protein
VTLIAGGDALPDITSSLAHLNLTFKPQSAEAAALALPANLPLDFAAGNGRINDKELLRATVVLKCMIHRDTRHILLAQRVNGLLTTQLTADTRALPDF